MGEIKSSALVLMVITAVAVGTAYLPATPAYQASATASVGTISQGNPAVVTPATNSTLDGCCSPLTGGGGRGPLKT